MSIKRVVRKVVEFVAINKPLLDALWYHAGAYHGRGDPLGCA